MNTTQRNEIMQRWRVLQHELLPELKQEVGALTPKLEQVVHTLEWVRIDEFVGSTWCGNGRPPHDRAALSSAFVAKAVLGLVTTKGLIERLSMDRALRRICGFSVWKRLPDESTFSRAFAEFAADGLAERAHAALIKETLGDQLIGHISRDGTAIESREKVGAKEASAEITQEVPAPADIAPAAVEVKVAPKRKPGRPRKDGSHEVRGTAPGKLEQQCGLPLERLLESLPRQCDSVNRLKHHSSLISDRSFIF